jgi:hypothetical protein
MGTPVAASANKLDRLLSDPATGAALASGLRLSACGMARFIRANRGQSNSGGERGSNEVGTRATGPVAAARHLFASSPDRPSQAQTAAIGTAGG